jgi:hypothetical protein
MDEGVTMDHSNTNWQFGQSYLAMYRRELSSYGLPGDDVGHCLLERMALLDMLTHVLDDERRAITLAKKVFAYGESIGEVFAEETKSLVLQGSLLTDIGKTGSPQASRTQQLITTKIFSIDDPKNCDPSTVSFYTHLIECFGSGRGSAMYAELYGFDDDIDRDLDGASGTLFTFRKFIDKHTSWGLELLRENGIPERVATAAMSHHFLESVNPHHILDDNGVYRSLGDSTTSIGTAEVLITLLDKYDAIRTRSGVDHETAITYLTNIVDGSGPRYRSMRENIIKYHLEETMRRMIHLIDKAL